MPGWAPTQVPGDRGRPRRTTLNKALQQTPPHDGVIVVELFERRGC